MGIRRAIPGYYPATALSTQPPASDRRERALPQAGWAGSRLGATPSRNPVSRCARAMSPPTPALQASGARSAGTCLSPGKRARFHVISSKVSQNGRVSPKYVKKACHSPCFQNGLVKSPLEFLRFPYSRAFSHKELLGHFDPHSGYSVKMTKCRPDVHLNVHAKWSPDTPMTHASKLASVGHSSSGSARYSQRVQN